MIEERCLECGEVRTGNGSSGAASVPACGTCGRTLAFHRVHLLSGKALEALLTVSPVPVLVDFFAEWCGPCRWLDPVLDGLADASHGRYVVAKVDTDADPEQAEERRIGSVPTVILFEKGEEVERSLGVEPERLREWTEVGDARGEGTG